MKRIVFIFLVFSYTLSAQVDKTYTISSDTVYWQKLRTDLRTNIIVDWTGLDSTVAVLEIVAGILETDTVILELSEITMDHRENYMKIYESDTTYSYGWSRDNWTYGLIGFKVTPNGTGGTLKTRIRK